MINNVLEQLCRCLQKRLTGEVLFPPDLCLGRFPDSCPGKFVHFPRKPHAGRIEFIQDVFISLNLFPHATGNIHIIESHGLPEGDSAVLLHFLYGLGGANSHTSLQKIRHTQKHTCTEDGCRLLHCHTEIPPHRSCLCPAQNLPQNIFVTACFLRTVQISHQVHKIFHSRCTQRIPDRLLDTHICNLTIAQILSLAVVEPLHSIHQRQRKSIILRHFCHVICENIKNRIHNHSILGIRGQALGKTLVQESPQICLILDRIFHIPGGIISLNGEVSIFRKLHEVPSGHADFITKSAANILHILLQIPCNRPLPICKQAIDCCNVIQCQDKVLFLDNIPLILGSPSEIFITDCTYANTAAGKMSDSLLTVAEAPEAHNLGSSHSDGLTGGQLDGMNLPLPVLRFLRLVGFLCESNRIMGCPCQFCLSLHEAFENLLCILAHSTERIPGRVVCPDKPVAGISLYRLSAAHFLHRPDCQFADSCF